MRINKLFYLFLVLLLSNCGTKKKTTYGKGEPVIVTSDGGTTTTTAKSRKKGSKLKADNVVAKAMTFIGTPYQYGGNTKRGMDCSGLVYVALKENNISFPRVSYQMANEGNRINLKKVQKGDLLFFKTSKSKKRINHVGLVVSVKGGDIRFIHSTSSRGVIVSSMREGYWNHAFIKAMRIL